MTPSLTPTFQNKTITYLSTTLTAAPTQLRVQSRSTQGFRGHIWTCPPTIMSSTLNTYPVPDAHRTPKMLGCTTNKVYDGTWHKAANRHCQMTPGFGWVFGLAIRVKVAMGGGTRAVDQRLRSESSYPHFRPFLPGNPPF